MSNPIITLENALYKMDVFEDRVTILGKKKSMQRGEKTIQLSQISSVQYKPARLFESGYIQFALPGSTSKGLGVMGAAFNEDAVLFDKKDNAQAEQVKVKIEELMVKAQSRQIQPQKSEADEIAKFKALLDSGAITQEEFDAKKKQLLGL